MNHTKGPLKLEYSDNGSYHSGEVFDSEGNVLAIITGHNFGQTFGGKDRHWSEGWEEEDYEEHKANGALFASAPELLDCLTMGQSLNTPDFLMWLADRLVNVYGENPNMDFVLSIRERANAMQAVLKKLEDKSYEE